MKKSNKELASIQLSQTIEQLNGKSVGEVVSIYNDYAEDNSYEHVFYNDEDVINACFKTPYEVLEKISHGNYFLLDAYTYFNDSGQLVSFDYINDVTCPIDISELAEWLVGKDKLSDYDISVTILDDMIASIEDNITDDENLLYKLCDYLNIKYNMSNDVENLTSHCMDYLYDSNYQDLNDIINHLSIDYK